MEKETKTAASLRQELDTLRYRLDSLGGAARLTQRVKIADVERELRALDPANKAAALPDAKTV